MNYNHVKYAVLILVGILLSLTTRCSSPPAQTKGGVPVVIQELEDTSEETYQEEVPPDFEPMELYYADGILPVSEFKEVWGYLMVGRESAINSSLPVSDLVYFGAEVDSYGKLVDVPSFSKIPSSFRGRKHLVVACNSRSLTHFTLIEGRPEREALIRDLLAEARPYDGLQIDFEMVPARDGELFLSFLRELRSGLGNKIFSIALPARTRRLQDDVYDYAKIKPIVDRILVMAYDEHWSTSAPGPIASMAWCQRVARYSLDTIGPEKLIMGLPFYGRSWGSENVNIAHVHSQIENLKKARNIEEIQRENSIPTFKYTMPLSVTVFYEDAHSLSTRMDLYKKMGVNSVGFWRLGQETPAFWPYIKLESASSR